VLASGRTQRNPVAIDVSGDNINGNRGVLRGFLVCAIRRDHRVVSRAPYEVDCSTPRPLRAPLDRALRRPVAPSALNAANSACRNSIDVAMSSA
jgi:hypothetical protein